jgi:acetyl esterase/lipase
LRRFIVRADKKTHDAVEWRKKVMGRASCSLIRRSFAILFLCGASGVCAQQVSLPLWPHGTPENPGVTIPDKEASEPIDKLVAGKPITTVKDVSHPSLAVYSPPTASNSGTAILVFPGGAYRRLAYDLEGTEVCQWLNSLGISCILVKYRVPFDGHFPQQVEDLEDAQQAMRITRSHAAEWRIDPQRVGALGFSAGAHLAVILGNHPEFRREHAPDNPMMKFDARPNFVLAIYPGYLSDEPELSRLAPGIDVSAKTPPTFLLQTEDDYAHVENSLLYFEALKRASVKAELHVFAEGGHGYGLRPTELPVTHWPALAERWFHTIGVLVPRAASN